MHNNIMAAGSRDRPPMLATGRYAQWRSRFLRYIDTRPNGDALRKCILTVLYSNMVSTQLFRQQMNSPDILQKHQSRQFEMTPENKAHYESEKKRLFDIVWNGDEIYSLLRHVRLLKKWWEGHESYSYKQRDSKPITPPSESASEEDSDPEQAQKDKDMQKNLALIAKYFKKLYKPTNNNLRTSSNTRNKEMWYYSKCFNCKEFGHYAKECRKPKRVRDSTYHKEKMLLCKQAEKGVQLQAEQSDWLADTDEEIDEQELEAHYSLHGKVSRVETGDSNVIPDLPDMCDNDIQNDQDDVECDDERAALAYLIANLMLDVDDN
ncbi:integrase, catalytic region, zinc finger, CCHC-type containing protein [Tanacetum coccineum]